MQEFLIEEYEKLSKKDITLSGRVNLLNNIIQFKINEPEFTNHKNDLSIDIKRYLKAIVVLAEDGPRLYDNIKKDQIIFLLSKIENYNDKINYINYFIRILERSSFKDEIKDFQVIRSKTIINNAIVTPWSIDSFLKLIVYLPLLNIWTLLCTLSLILLVVNLVLLPAPYEFMAWINFKITYINLSDHFIVNHFANITSFLIGIDNNIELRPQNTFSMFLLILSKVFAFVYITSLIFNKLIDLIKR